MLLRIINFLNNFHYDSILNYSKRLDFQIMIDVGSHKGEFISRFLKIKKIKKLYCFEPNKNLFNRLKKIYKPNKKVFLSNIALGKNNNIKRLFLSNLTFNSTISKFNNKSIYLKIKNLILKDFDNNFINVKQKSFDEIFSNINLKKSFLKIDVEGYELDVLKGAKKKIKDVKYILIEHQFFDQYDNDFNQVNKILNKYDFIEIKSFKYPLFHYRDVLFINKKYN